MYQNCAASTDLFIYLFFRDLTLILQPLGLEFYAIGLSIWSQRISQKFSHIFLYVFFDHEINVYIIFLFLFPPFGLLSTIAKIFLSLYIECQQNSAFYCIQEKNIYIFIIGIKLGSNQHYKYNSYLSWNNELMKIIKIIYVI